MGVNIDRIEDKLLNSPFGEQFRFNMQMYQYRLERVLSIDTTIKENQMEYLMTFDAFLALFRGLFLERLENCYTVQSYFKAIGRDDISERIDSFLSEPFNEYSDVSIRKVLKFLADKFVCHLDPITFEELGLANAYMATLKNPYEKVNLQYIATELNKIMNDELESII